MKESKAYAGHGQGVICEPLVSVVIPTFNRSELVARAIRSVREQTYSNLEIIVVDDASRDDTQKVVTGMSDARIRYIRHETNRGGSGTRNTGIRAATGEYIAFLDDDDEWEPSKTEEQLKMLQTYDVVLCTSSELNGRLAQFDKRSEITLDDLRKGYFTAGGTGVLMAKAAAIKGVMFDEELPRCQDWDVFIRLAQEHKVGYLNRALVRYNEGNHARISNEISNMSASELMKRLPFLEKHKTFLGLRWYKRHKSRLLLYGLRFRTDKWHHLLFTVRECGLVAVAWALSRRIYQKATESI